MTDENPVLRVLDILPGTSVDGPGLRCSIYFAGCDHHCQGCHNPQSWDFDGGREMSVSEIVEEIDRHGFNVTFTGGDPIYQSSALTILAEELTRKGYTIWCYTGFKFETLIENPDMKRLLKNIEVMVDGPFIEHLKDTTLLFRGSSNQRLIDVSKSSLEDVRLWSSPF